VQYFVTVRVLGVLSQLLLPPVVRCCSQPLTPAIFNFPVGKPHAVPHHQEGQLQVSPHQPGDGWSRGQQLQDRL